MCGDRRGPCVVTCSIELAVCRLGRFARPRGIALLMSLVVERGVWSAKCGAEFEQCMVRVMCDRAMFGGCQVCVPKVDTQLTSYAGISRHRKPGWVTCPGSGTWSLEAMLQIVKNSYHGIDEIASAVRFRRSFLLLLVRGCVDGCSLSVDHDAIPNRETRWWRQAPAERFHNHRLRNAATDSTLPQPSASLCIS